MSTLFTAGAVAAEIKARIQTILLTSGCETDIGRDVKMGKRSVVADGEVPCTRIIEGNDDVQDRPGRMPTVLASVPYLVDAYDVCDPDNPNDKAHAMIRDIKRAIFAGDATLGGKVHLVVYHGRDIGPRPDGVAFVRAQVVIEVQYVEDLTSP